MPASQLVIPVQKAEPLPGELRWPSPVGLHSPHEGDWVGLDQLRGELAEQGLEARRTSDGARATVALRRAPEIPTEGYRLTAVPGQVIVESADDAGAYYGIQTLRSLIRLHGHTLPGIRIEDRPLLRRRGVYHDCARGKVPKVETVIALVERLAHWKLNELQLYIENGFRFARHPQIGVGYSPFSPVDILAIQAACKRHHVTLVGSLASFGHMEKILMLPRYHPLAETPGQPYREMGGATTLCPTDPGSLALLTDLYEEFLPLFESSDFNACGDETWELGQGRSRPQAQATGVGRLYLGHILGLHGLCRRLGKRMNLWADIVLAHPDLTDKLPRNICLLNWDYEPDGPRIPRTADLVQRGFPVVCCPGVHGWQSHGSRMERANANILQFADTALSFGAEGLLVTDWGDLGHRNPLGVSLHGFALGAACAWNRPGVDPRGFAERFCLDLFGDTGGRLADAVRLLGADDGDWLYHALVRPLGARPEPWRPYGVRRARSRLDGLADFKVPDLPVGGEFERLALAEYALAAEMDRLACRRVIAGGELRKRRLPDPAELAGIGSGMRALGEAFADLWTARNAPSRLCDALHAIEGAAREAEAMACGTARLRCGKGRSRGRGG